MGLSGAPISVDELRTVVRSTIAGAAHGPVTIEEVTRHTNLNYVCRVVVGETTLFVKAIPPRLKRFGVALPQSRMFDEVRAMRIVREQSGGAAIVPEIAFVDERRFLICMTDVSGGRTLAADAVDPDDAMELMAEVRVRADCLMPDGCARRGPGVRRNAFPMSDAARARALGIAGRLLATPPAADDDGMEM